MARGAGIPVPPGRARLTQVACQARPIRGLNVLWGCELNLHPHKD